MAFRSRLPLLLGLLLFAITAGCRAVETHAEYPADLYHPDYVKRSKAVATFAERKDKSQLPDAFRLLLDDDGNVRLIAYGAIRELSPGGEDFGYRPYLSREVRFGIVVRWQTWWVKGGGTGKATAAPTADDGGAPEQGEAAHG